MALKLKPLGDRIIVEPIEDKEQQSDGGIIIPDSAKEKPTEAKVLALGTGKTDDNGNKIAFEVKKGDKVRHAVLKETGKHGKALAYKSYRGKHWSPNVYVVVKINTGGGLPARYYVAGNWRYRDTLLLVPEVDEATKAEVALRKYI